MPTLDITGKTTVYAIIADPIDHVRAPMVFNPAFEAFGIDAVKVPFHVKPKDLPAAIAGMKAIQSLGGLTVTVPHKVALMALCAELGPSARRVGAVNAARFTEDRRLIGDNFDGQGYVAGVVKGGFDFIGKRVLQAGAGGAGMAIAFAVAEAGAGAITITNRTVAKAEELAARVRASFPDCEVMGASADTAPTGFDIAVNTTSLGLHAGDALPFDVDALDPGTVVSEIIMIPEETDLLAHAEAKGHPVHYGRPMLDEQARLIASFIGCPFPQ